MTRDGQRKGGRQGTPGASTEEAEVVRRGLGDAEPLARGTPDAEGVRGFPPERQDRYPVAGGAVEAVDQRADEEEAAADAHEPLGPSGWVEERDITGGPATAYADRVSDATRQEANEPSPDLVLEGPDAGPVLTVGPPVAPGPARRAGPMLGSRWLDPYAAALQHVREWTRDVAGELGTDDPRVALLALRAVLATLRDQLTVAEMADLGAQLPVMVRGLYFEGWTGHPDRVDTAAELRDRVARRIGREGPLDPDQAVRAVCAVLRRHVTVGEIDDVLGVLPSAVRELVEG